jgi:tRNA1(Val) A37 N6-methylase TrmN6
LFFQQPAIKKVDTPPDCVYNSKVLDIDNSDITQDYFYKKKVIIFQRKNGFRFSVDAPLLADFLPFHPSEEAVEIGTGCGIISMLALYKKKFAKIYGLELQDTLSGPAQINAEQNGFSHQFEVIPGDFNDTYKNKELRGIGHIFSNPPYFKLNRGRLSPNPEIRAAKFETRLTLQQLVEKSRTILNDKGSLYLVLPYDRYDELTALSLKNGFFTRKIREVFSFKDGKAERFLVQLTPYNVSTEKLEPLIIFKEKGTYTEEMDEILTG